MKMIRALTAAAVLAMVPVASAMAQDWPSKPVKILIGFGAGGGTDVATRIVADGLSELLGQQFVVENRAGAGGTIAGGVVAKAPKDGYTALAISMGHAVSAVMVKHVPYDPVNDFAPIGIFTNSAFVVAVPKNSPATDLKSLVEHINKSPGKLNYSTVGLGSTQHLIAEDLRQRLTEKMPSRSLIAPPVMWSARCSGAMPPSRSSSLMPFAARWISGDLRLIAVATPKRWPAIANIPTVAESSMRISACSDGTGLRSPPVRRSRSSTRCTRR